MSFNLQNHLINKTSFWELGLPQVDGTQVDAETIDTVAKPAESETTPVDEIDNDEIIGKRKSNIFGFDHFGVL